MAVMESVKELVFTSMLWWFVFRKAYQVFTINDSDGVCDGEPVSISIWGVLIFVKLHVLTINGRDGAFDRACFILMLWQSAFSKSSGLYYKWQ